MDLLDVLKWVFAKSDPMLTGCIIALGYWIHKVDTKINTHTSPDNKAPHTGCEWGEKSYLRLEQALKEQHQETQQLILKLLEGKDE